MKRIGGQSVYVLIRERDEARAECDRLRAAGLELARAAERWGNTEPEVRQAFRRFREANK